jgi:hypothetical protein
VLVHHPYESCDASVARFIRATADDPKVQTLKMTVYRVGSDTPFIDDLILFVPGILVVDDEPHVLGLLDGILQLGGFAVWLAASGPEAFDIYRQHTAQIAAVLLDVRMTGWDGPETLKDLQASIPPCVSVS